MEIVKEDSWNKQYPPFCCGKLLSDNRVISEIIDNEFVFFKVNKAGEILYQVKECPYCGYDFEEGDLQW